MQNAIDKLHARPGGSDIELPGIGHNNKWLLNMYDPDRTRIELMEPFTFR